MPDFELESAAGGMVAGVDEAGRGPLAGPVVAAAAVIDEARLDAALRDRIDDSKKLSAAKRVAIFAELAGCARLAVGAASVAEIDRLNILGATMLAMRRAVLALGILPDLVLIDGNRTPELPCPARAVIGGDARCLSIAAASIAAKVTRDRIMASLAARHPGFGWERNAGYGTAAHRKALIRLGPTAHHRRSFAPVAELFG
ncbi:MAG TPA: ribonuclease HII [Alphaproteobacteria bacterium]|nr:ribonuclease HII [Alphaproteobacteria bacterium]